MADSDDVLKKAGGLLNKLGKAAKEAGEKVAAGVKENAPKAVGAMNKAGNAIADGVKENAPKAVEALNKAGDVIVDKTKQVTGLGRGQIKLELDQTRAAPGGTITGRLVLDLKEPVEAKRLVVALTAHQRMVNVTKDSGHRSVGTTSANVYNFEVELGGATTYKSETLSFELTIPPDALDLKASPPTTPLGDVVRSVAAAVSPTAGPIQWQVAGRMEIPWGRNLTHDVDIVVTR
ncbi:MAG TPA: hypothetical protein VMZ53_00240 [Kofleriaceae bacterium]|nr:hypothetical protein [Kofleriaceae bacterium]